LGSSGLSEFAKRRPLHVVGTRGFPWTEIDFPQDYRRAHEEIFPQIMASPDGTPCSIIPNHEGGLK
jgi:choline kinase